MGPHLIFIIGIFLLSPDCYNSPPQIMIISAIILFKLFSLWNPSQLILKVPSPYPFVKSLEKISRSKYFFLSQNSFPPYCGCSLHVMRLCFTGCCEIMLFSVCLCWGVLMEDKDLEKFFWTHFISNQIDVCSISRSLICWIVLKISKPMQ